MEYVPTEHSESVGGLFAALAKAQGQFNGASKSADNPFFKSKYADLYECLEAVKGPLSENELAVVQTIESCESGIIIATTLGHSSGEWIRGRIRMTPKKDDDQGRGSSITYGRRYSFAAIVGLAQKDDDGNGSCGNDTSKTKTPKVKPELTPEKTDAFNRAIAVYKKDKSFAAIEKHMSISEDVKIMIQDAAK